MQRKKSAVFLLLACFLILIFSGCKQSDDTKESQLSLIKTTDPSPTVVNTNSDKKMDTLEKVRETVLSSPAIYDVAIVKKKKEILIAYKVKQLKRFQMKKIEKELKSQLKKKYPDNKFTISSDYKIFLEVVRLNEKIGNDTYDEKEAKKHFDEIVNLTKELT